MDQDTVQKAEAELKGEAPALLATFASPGFKLFLKWIEALEDSYGKLVLRADTSEDWREARAEWMAIRKMRFLPEQLLAKIKNLDTEAEPPK